jgi:hypothetical protein
MLPAVTETVTFTTSASEAEAGQVILRVVLGERHGIPQKRSGEWDVVRLGSRLSFRLWGGWGRRVDRRLPIEMRSKVGTEHGSTVVSLLFSNDEGPYLFSVPIRERLFTDTFSMISSRIRTLLPDAS